MKAYDSIAKKLGFNNKKIPDLTKMSKKALKEYFELDEKYEKKKEEYIDYYRLKDYQMNTIEKNNTLPKGHFAKGYKNSLKILTGGNTFTVNNRKSTNNEKNIIKDIFRKSKKYPNDPFVKGQLTAIRDVKRHRNLNGKNLYNEDIKR